MNKTITVKEIKACRPCGPRLKVFLAAYPNRKRVTWREIIESNGLDDLLWLLGEIDTGLVRELACDYAEHVLPIWEAEYPDDDRSRRCLEVTRAYLRGEATLSELGGARSAFDADSASSAVHAANAAYAVNAVHAHAVVNAVINTAAIAALDADDYDTERNWQIEHTLEKIERWKK